MANDALQLPLYLPTTADANPLVFLYSFFTTPVSETTNKVVRSQPNPI